MRNWGGSQGPLPELLSQVPSQLQGFNHKITELEKCQTKKGGKELFIEGNITNTCIPVT